MACTATATKSVRQEVIESLEMRGCIQVSGSPDRPNIFYEVRKCTNIEDDMLGLVRMLKAKQKDTPRVIVYCQTINTCAELP